MDGIINFFENEIYISDSLANFLQNMALAAMLCLFLFFAVYVLFYMQAKKIDVRHETFYDRYDGEKGIKAVFISDLHINCLAADEFKIISLIRDANPDIIIFGGDFANSPKYRDQALKFTENLQNAVACPMYIVYGNHDYMNMFGKNQEFKADFTGKILDISPSIHVLENSCAIYRKEDKTLLIGGLSDVSVNKSDVETICRQWKKQAETENARFLAVSHNPDILLKTGSEAADIFLSGHTHGGQIRVPLNLEFRLLRRKDKLPCKGYSQGRHIYNGTPLYISTGLGCSLLPLRWGTCAEIVVLSIH